MAKILTTALLMPGFGSALGRLLGEERLEDDLPLPFAPCFGSYQRDATRQQHQLDAISHAAHRAAVLRRETLQRGECA